MDFGWNLIEFHVRDELLREFHIVPVYGHACRHVGRHVCRHVCRRVHGPVRGRAQTGTQRVMRVGIGMDMCIEDGRVHGQTCGTDMCADVHSDMWADMGIDARPDVLACPYICARVHT